jgi:hypothetical protein
VKDIQLCLKNKWLDNVTELLADSCCRCEEERAGIRSSYGRALNAWLSPGVQASQFERDEAWGTLSEELEERLIAPLLDLVTEAKDAITANSVTMLANVSRAAHALWAELAVILQRERLKNNGGLPPKLFELLKQAIQLTDQIISLNDQVRTCKRPRQKPAADHAA